jgi:hypothetical protein
LGSSLFARHYSGSRGFFPFLRVLRCFSSPAYLHLPYVFRQGYARITTRGFPHSDTPGSKVGQHLPGAFRSRPRPSSALGAKASTVCPYSLDRKEHVLCRYGVFKVRAERSALPRHRASVRRQTCAGDREPGPSKLNSVQPLCVRHRCDRSRSRLVEVDMIPGELCEPDDRPKPSIVA